MESHDYVGQDLEALADIPNYQRWILSHFRPHLRGRVLEIGAGIGSLSARYVDRVDSAVLLEPASNLIGPLRDRFRHRSHVTVLGRHLEAAELDERSFDAIVLINVLEHVDDDAAMLRHIHRLLKPTAALLLFVPALQWLFGTLDELVGHRRRYVKDALHTLLSHSGFTVRDLRYFDVLGVLPWYVTGRVLKQRAFSANAARIYDAIGVPLGSFAEGFAAPAIGKNLLSIAHRE